MHGLCGGGTVRLLPDDRRSQTQQKYANDVQSSQSSRLPVVKGFHNALRHQCLFARLCFLLALLFYFNLFTRCASQEGEDIPIIVLVRLDQQAAFLMIRGLVLNAHVFSLNIPITAIGVKSMPSANHLATWRVAARP